MIAICKHCNEEFFKNRKDKVFCSAKCKVKNKDKRIPRRLEKLRNKAKSRRNKALLFYTKDPKCKNCNFVAIHPCQLDIDHLDGNHSNNNIENLQTLCANCHRLKTYLNKDWQSK